MRAFSGRNHKINDDLNICCGFKADIESISGEKRVCRKELEIVPSSEGMESSDEEFGRSSTKNLGRICRLL